MLNEPPQDFVTITQSAVSNNRDDKHDKAEHMPLQISIECGRELVIKEMKNRDPHERTVSIFFEEPDNQVKATEESKDIRQRYFTPFFVPQIETPQVASRLMRLDNPFQRLGPQSLIMSPQSMPQARLSSRLEQRTPQSAT